VVPRWFLAIRAFGPKRPEIEKSSADQFLAGAPFRIKLRTRMYLKLLYKTVVFAPTDSAIVPTQRLKAGCSLQYLRRFFGSAASISNRTAAAESPFSGP
jgi:hypothetical protein